MQIVCKESAYNPTIDYKTSSAWPVARILFVLVWTMGRAPVKPGPPRLQPDNKTR